MTWFLKTESVLNLKAAEDILEPILQQKGFGIQVAPFTSNSGHVKIPIDPKLLGSIDVTAGSTATAGSATAAHATYSWDWRWTPDAAIYGNTVEPWINVSSLSENVGLIITGLELDPTTELITHFQILSGQNTYGIINCEELYCARSDVDPEGYNGLGFFPMSVPVIPETKLLVNVVCRTASVVIQKIKLRGYAYVKSSAFINTTGETYV